MHVTVKTSLEKKNTVKCKALDQKTSVYVYTNHETNKDIHMSCVSYYTLYQRLHKKKVAGILGKPLVDAVHVQTTSSA